jgi:N-ethylmaleimide reductase
VAGHPSSCTTSFADIAARVRDIDEGLADIVSVGVMALANPDLVELVRTDAPLNDPDPATFYGGGEAGYTDYPTHAA